MPTDGQQSGLEDVAEDSPFVRLLETKARVKMLDVLLRHSYTGMSEQEIADRANLNQSTVNRNITVFQDLGVVTTENGWPTTYRLNQDSSVVQGLEQAKLGLLGDVERLLEDDVRQLEDHREWVPIEDLSDSELRALVTELQTELGVKYRECPGNDWQSDECHLGTPPATVV